MFHLSFMKVNKKHCVSAATEQTGGCERQEAQMGKWKVKSANLSYNFA